MNSFNIFNVPVDLIDCVLHKFPPVSLCRMRRTCSYFDEYVERNSTRLGKRIFSNDCTNVQELFLFDQNVLLKINLPTSGGRCRLRRISLEYSKDFPARFSGIGVKTVFVATRLETIKKDIVNKISVTGRVYVENLRKFGYTCRKFAELLKEAKFPEKFDVMTDFDDSIALDKVVETFLAFNELEMHTKEPTIIKHVLDHLFEYDSENLTHIKLRIEYPRNYDLHNWEQITTLWKPPVFNNVAHVGWYSGRFYGYFEVGAKYGLISYGGYNLDIRFVTKDEQSLKEMALKCKIPPFYKNEGWTNSKEHRQYQIMQYYDCVLGIPLRYPNPADMKKSPYIFVETTEPPPSYEQTSPYI